MAGKFCDIFGKKAKIGDIVCFARRSGRNDFLNIGVIRGMDEYVGCNSEALCLIMLDVWQNGVLGIGLSKLTHLDKFLILSGDTFDESSPISKRARELKNV